ncbi:MAG: ATP-binding protein [Cyclobacteriaceae bacterium]
MIRQFCGFILLVLSCVNFVLAQSWEKARVEKEATLDCYWFTSLPFIYKDAKSQLKGIEHDLLYLFQEYLMENDGIRLEINWVEHDSFSGIMDTVAKTASPNMLGVSAFSITEDRKKFLQFTNPYLPDVTVLVSSEGTPIMNTSEEIEQMIDEMKAVTIKGTTYEGMLKDLKIKLGVDFEIIYIESDNNILDNVKENPNRFAFIDLPIYLMLIKRGGELTRQNFFTVQGTGYGLIMPQSSDWGTPLNAFFADPEYKRRIEAIKSNYLGSELYSFIEQLAPSQELGTSILTKEKELQLAVIKNANLKLEEEEGFQKVLITAIVVTALFLLVIIVLFMNNHRNTKVLLVQKNKIESQQKDIRTKNEQLTNRNVQLLNLNEDKNNLVKILAHDLRSPLNQIIGFGDVLQSQAEELSVENRYILVKINSAALRMEQMISKILNTDNIDRQNGFVLKESIELHKLIEDLIERYHLIAFKKGINLVPSPISHEFRFQTDHILLFLILENLLSNAIKFSPANTEINFNVRTSERFVIFEVKDQGPGLSAEDQAHAFKRFKKLSPKPTGDETSTGLGLSIVKRYVTDLGGKVWIESELGKGSSFFVTLPV